MNQVRDQIKKLLKWAGSLPKRKDFPKILKQMETESGTYIVRNRDEDENKYYHITVEIEVTDKL